MPFTKTIPELCQSSYWLSMNLLMVSPDKAIVEETETPVINYLESLGKYGMHRRKYTQNFIYFKILKGD